MTRYHYSLATILMLIVLRLNIGWHFYSEGMHHVFDRSWSSEGFLRAAKGPLAPHFQQYLPDRYGWDKIMHGQYEAGPATDALINGIGDSWRDYRKDLAAHYKLSEEQSKEADAILKRRQGQLDDWRSEHQDAINDYLHEWNRLDRARAEKSALEVPYQKQRIAAELAKRNAEANGWLAELFAMEQSYKGELRGLLTDEQQNEPPLEEPRQPLQQIDTVMKYGILTIGVCLLLGLFTRLACILGAAFLLSVVLTQPFWVSDAQPTFNQFVEMFALLALATTAVGRWGGLDFFIHRLFARCCGRAKGSRDESHA
jgi:hypothetical protein